MSDESATPEKFFNRQDLVAMVVERANLPRGKAVIVVDTVFSAITDTLKAGREIRLVGFGSFNVMDRKATKGHDPRTGAEIDIPEGKSVKFRAGKGLREAISPPKS